MVGDPAQTLAERLIGSSHALLDSEHCRVLAEIEQRRPLSLDAADVADETAAWSDRLSDRVAAIGGSWRFIIGFSVVLFGWTLLNSDVLSHSGLAFDPYPHIFLNLTLSTLAAVRDSRAATR